MSRNLTKWEKDFLGGHDYVPYESAPWVLPMAVSSLVFLRLFFFLLLLLLLLLVALLLSLFLPLSNMSFVTVLRPQRVSHMGNTAGVLWSFTISHMVEGRESESASERERQGGI